MASDLEILDSPEPEQSDNAALGDDLESDLTEDDSLEEISDDDSGEEKSEETDKEESDEAEEEPQPPDEDEDARTFTNRPTLREVKAKYPSLFKDFPGLKDAMFREAAFNEVFPTIAEAKEAATKASTFDRFEGDLLSGDADKIIRVIHGANPESAKNFIKSFLPTLSRLDHGAYVAAVNPFLQHLVRDVFSSGKKKGDENLANSALHLMEYLGFDPEVLNAQAPRQDPELDAEKQKLQRDQQQFFQQRYQASLDRIATAGNTEIGAALEEAISKDKLTDLEREALKGKILRELDIQFAKDAKHQSLMASLWRRAEKAGFAGSAEEAILTAYVSRAKALLPGVINQVKVKTLGKRASEPAKPKVKPNPDMPASRTSNAPLRKGEIDWSRTSDEDILNGRAARRR